MIGSLSSISALRATNAFHRTGADLDKTLERLATGKKLNRASDDPAGSITATALDGERKSIEAQLKSLESEEAFLGAREGGQQAIGDLLTSLRGLVVSAANRGALSDAERAANQLEVDSILKSIDYLGQTTTFKGQQILTGVNTALLGRTAGGLDANGQSTSFSLADLKSGGRLNVIDGDAETADRVVRSAASAVSTEAGGFGARGNQIDSQRRELQTRLENTNAAFSQIVDADIAEETSKLVRQQVLQQAQIFSMQLALKQSKELTLALLR